MSRAGEVYSLRRTAARRLGQGALVLGVWLAGCAPSDKAPPPAQAPSSPPELELAEVAGRSITLGDYTAFYADMPAYLQSSRPGMEKARNHLQTLIDMELLQLEAVERGIHKSPAYLRTLNRQRQERLVGLYQVRMIRPQVTPEQVREQFDRQGLARSVRFSSIVVPSRDSARAVLRELGKGKSFAEVASKWSIDRASAQRGGDSWVFVNKKELEPELGEALFALKVGEVSGPVDLGGTWGIFEASEEKRQELDARTTQMIYKDLYLKDHIRRRGLLADSLRQAYHLELDRKGMDTFLARMRQGVSMEAEDLAGITLYRFDGGTISGADLTAAAAQYAPKGFDPKQREAVLALAATSVVPDALSMEAAKREGLEQEMGLKEWMAEKARQLLIAQLRVVVLKEGISISEEEMRAYHEQHPEKFKKLEQIQIQEVLVATAEEAAEVARRVKNGESLGEQARQRTLRPADQRDEEGRLTLFSTYSKALHLDLIRAAQEAEPGDLVGPVETKEGHSVFRVLSRKGEQESFEEARKRVRATLNWIKKQQVFEAFVAGLRQRRAAQVEVQEDHLRQAFDKE
ncbi:MAG: hypothetical protein FJX77_00255 [Armatimonadetes bacterium]|nr:hypothetical protein [Armatimonadota bacterium]